MDAFDPEDDAVFDQAVRSFKEKADGAGPQQLVELGATAAPKSCGKRADVALIIDSSGSVDTTEWELQADFMRAIVKGMGVGEKKVEYGISAFASSGKTLVSMHTHEREARAGACARACQRASVHTGTDAYIRTHARARAHAHIYAPTFSHKGLCICSARTQCALRVQRACSFVLKRCAVLCGSAQLALTSDVSKVDTLPFASSGSGNSGCKSADRGSWNIGCSTNMAPAFSLANTMLSGSTRPVPKITLMLCDGNPRPTRRSHAVSYIKAFNSSRCVMLVSAGQPSDKAKAEAEAAKLKSKPG